MQYNWDHSRVPIGITPESQLSKQCPKPPIQPNLFALLPRLGEAVPINHGGGLTNTHGVCRQWGHIANISSPSGGGSDGTGSSRYWWPNIKYIVK